MRNKLPALLCSAYRALALWDGQCILPQFEYFQKIGQTFCIFSYSGCGVLMGLDIFIYLVHIIYLHFTCIFMLSYIYNIINMYSAYSNPLFNTVA